MTVCWVRFEAVWARVPDTLDQATVRSTTEETERERALLATVRIAWCRSTGNGDSNRMEVLMLKDSNDAKTEIAKQRNAD